MKYIIVGDSVFKLVDNKKIDITNNAAEITQFRLSIPFIEVVIEDE